MFQVTVYNLRNNQKVLSVSRLTATEALEAQDEFSDANLFSFPTAVIAEKIS